MNKEGAVGDTREYRPWSKPCSWISFIVLLLLWYAALPQVLDNVLASGAKTAFSVGRQMAWCVAGLVVMVMAFRIQLRLVVSRGRVMGVLVFSLLWPCFLQGFELGGTGATKGTIQAEVVLSLVALTLVALVLGEVIRLPGRRRWIQWRPLNDDDDDDEKRRFDEDQRMFDKSRRENDPGIAGSAAWWAKDLLDRDQHLDS